MLAKIARSSRSYVLYRVSVSVSFLEKNPIGLHSPFSSCSKVAPIALVEASVVSLSGVFGAG